MLEPARYYYYFKTGWAAYSLSPFFWQHTGYQYPKNQTK
jgi:hypothetical protein